MASCLDPGAGRGTAQWQVLEPQGTVATDSVGTFYRHDWCSCDYLGTSARHPWAAPCRGCGYFETGPSERGIAIASLETKVEAAGIPTPAIRAHAPPMSAVAPLGGLNERILCRRQGFAVWPDRNRRRRIHQCCNGQESTGYNGGLADHSLHPPSWNATVHARKIFGHSSRVRRSEPEKRPRHKSGAEPIAW
jgi:hypothetical protein